MSSKENPESYDENDDSPIEIDELEEVAKIKLYSGNIWSITIRRFVRNKSSLIGLFLLIFIIVIPAFFAETLTNTFDFVYADTVRFQTYIPFYQPPGYHTEANGTVNFHLLGTDNLGKDVFTVLIYGARISLVVGVVSTILSMVIGIPVGLISGYFGGMVDELLMKLTDLFLTFPFYFVMIVFIITIQGNLQLSLFLDSVNLTDSVNIAAIVIGLGLFGWSGTARLRSVWIG